MVPPRLRHIPGIALLIVAASIQPVIMVNETRAGQLVNRRYWEVSSFDSIERNRAEQRRDEAIFNLRKHKREIASGTAPMDLKALQQKRQDLYQARVRHDKELAKIENERTRRVLAASFANQSDTQPPTPMLVILASVMTISGWALLSRSSRGQKIS